MRSISNENRVSLQQAWLFAAREYRERVRSRAFLLTTFLTPLLLCAVFGGSYLLVAHGNANQQIAIVSNDRQQAASIAAELRDSQDAPHGIEVVSPAGSAALARLNRRIEAKQLNGYLLVSRNNDVPHAVYVSGSSADVSTAQAMANALNRANTRAALTGRGFSTEDASQILRRIPVETEQLRHGKTVASNNRKSFAGAYVLVILLYVVVLTYGMNVARSVVQEKTSRIYEVLLSAARADSLMLGKLLGVSAAGLTQIAIWFALLALLTGTGLAAGYGLQGTSSLGIGLGQLAYFILFFTLGFLFYCSISAGIGALVGAEQELQQFSFVIAAPLMISVLLMTYVLSNPSSTASVILSLIPPFTSVVMYLRICAQQPPMWQLVLSVGLLVGSILFIVWIAARIYRIGILMYGKRPTLPEILRWISGS